MQCFLTFSDSSSEVVLFQCSHCYNLTDNILVHSYDPELVFRIEDVMIFASDDIPRDDLVKGFLHKLQIIQDLELTIEETTIASALCLMIPGTIRHYFLRIYIKGRERERGGGRQWRSEGNWRPGANLFCAPLPTSKKFLKNDNKMSNFQLIMCIIISA